MRVVVAEPGKRAEVREIDDGYEAMCAVVGGPLEVVPVGILDRLDCWLNEIGRIEGLPPNRLVRAPSGGWWDIYGTLFIARSNAEGDTVGLDPEDADTIVALLNGSAFCRPLDGNTWEE